MIKIAHLYYDLMNLYGESGNIKALKNYFETQGIKVKVDKITLNDQFEIKKYDLIYIGSGTENYQRIVLEDILKYQKDIKKYIENGGFVLATGNALDLFGNKIIDTDSKEFNALGIFDFDSIEQNNRIVCETIADCLLLKKEVIGFQNHSCIMNSNVNNLFTIKQGIASNYDTVHEGIHYKNFFGTYLIGPLLVRNSHLLQFIGKSLMKSKKIKFKKVDFYFENKAYENHLKNYN